MSKFVWSDALAVGDPKMDLQHKKLMHMMNGLGECAEAGFSHDILIQLLDEMTTTFRNHFDNEEALLAAKQQNGLDDHKAIHDHFINIIIKLKCCLNEDNKADALDLYEELNNQFVQHMLNETI